jgi:hypothetical protein
MENSIVTGEDMSYVDFVEGRHTAAPAPIAAPVAPSLLEATHQAAAIASAEIEVLGDPARAAFEAGHAAAAARINRGHGMRIEAPVEALPALPVRIEAPTPEAGKYLAILERRIAEGTQRAAAVMRGIESSVPTDRIAKLGAVKWEPTAGNRGIVANVGGDVLTPTDYAIGQIAERAGVPGPYLRGLLEAAAPGAEPAPSWKRELAAEILTRHYTHHEGRALVRSVGNSLRGWLSDSYRRLDSRPLLEAMVTEADKHGALPYDGHATETRVAIKMILPRVVEPIPGEYMIVGAEWSNSDYGNGTHGVRVFAVRVVCLNGMTNENLLKQVHLGKRLGDDTMLSDRTLRLDTATSASALRDVVRGAFGPARTENLMKQITTAAAAPFASAQIRAALKSLPKTTTKAVIDAFESGDVINLPAGENAWRASNAISWIARHEEDAERRLDLERLAGSVMPAAPKAPSA